MIEQYVSGLSGRRLDAAIDAAAASLVLVSAPAGMPAGRYRLRIDDEVLTGTYSGSGVTLSSLARGLEGTTAAAHRAGVFVRHVFSGQSISKLLTIEEADGNPSLEGVRKIVVSNGTLSLDGTTATIDTGGGGGAIAVQEQDGAPAVATVSAIAVPNGSLTDNGSGSVSLSYSQPGHTHAESDVTDLASDLAGKAATGHTHSALLPAGGSTAQRLSKASNSDYDTAWTTEYGGFDVVIDGAGSPITTGDKLVVRAKYDMTITRVSLAPDVSGSIVVDIKKCSFAGYPGSLASICASAKPTLSSAPSSEDATLTGWTTAVARGDMLLVHVDSATTVTRVTLSVEGERT